MGLFNPSNSIKMVDNLSTRIKYLVKIFLILVKRTLILVLALKWRNKPSLGILKEGYWAIKKSSWSGNIEY